ncbi:MAG: lipoate--protein ligase family protein [Deltaproteobacteria bacterium]|nr:lipoate--protein ligase family protein [Deltaproteobacteria bacterium]
MDLFQLGHVPWVDSQLCYHALAQLGREGLIIVSPKNHYVCVGYHQDARLEVDLDYCKSHDIPVFRRQVGGGAVYLDGNQLFFQIVLHRNSPLAPLNKETFYRKFLRPVIEVYRRIGIPAQFKAINDIVTDGKKISGTGAGEIADCIVFVGNLILDFDYKTMSRVLNVPDEKFRDKVHRSMEANLTTIRRELGLKRAEKWTHSELNRLMIEEFCKVLGPLTHVAEDNELATKMNDLGKLMNTESWLYRRGRVPNGRQMKIRSGVNLIHRVHKAQGGLIRADFEIMEGKYTEVCFSGDWFCYPQDAISVLESKITGVFQGELGLVIEKFYDDYEIDTPGITIDDWIAVLKV